MAIEPILNLTSILAKDLRQEFYPVFKSDTDLFSTLVECIDPMNPESSELFFHCLAYIFKYLSKYIIKDLDFWFEKYIPLIGHKKWYIRKFAAESFSFLIQKLAIEDLKIYFDKVFAILGVNPNPIVYDGTSILFFETMKGVYGHFHSTMPKMMPLLFRNLDHKKNESEAIMGPKFLLVKKCVQLLAHHSLNRTVSENLWKCFEDEMNYLMIQWKKAPNKNLGMQFGHFATLLQDIFSKDTYKSQILLNLLNLLVQGPLIHKQVPSEAKRAILSLVEYSLEVSRGDLLQPFIHETKTLINICEVTECQLVLEFFKKINLSILVLDKPTIEEFKVEFIQIMFDYISKHFSSNMEICLAFLVEFMVRWDKPISVQNNDLTHLVHKTLTSRFDVIFKNDNFEKLAGAIEDQDGSLQPWVTWACIVFLQSSNLSKEYMEESVTKFMTKLNALITKTSFSVNLELVKLLSEMIRYVSIHSTDFSKLGNVLKMIFVHLSNQPLILKSLYQVILKLTKYPFDTETVWPYLKENLSSKNNIIRTTTLEILDKLPPVLTNSKAKWNVIHFLMQSEECGIDFDQERNKIYLLHKTMDEISRNGKDYEAIHWEIISYYILGGYFVKYSEVWPLIKKIAEIVLRFEPNTFWTIFYPTLKFWHHFDLTNEVPREKSFLYTRERIKVDKIKFSDYDKIFSGDIFSLEKIFASSLIEDFDHTDYGQYFTNVWELFGGINMTRKMFDSVKELFDEFFEYFKLKEQGIKPFDEKSKVTQRLKVVIAILSKFDSKCFQNQQDLERLIMGLVVTQNVEIQSMALNLITKFNLPWFMPYATGLKNIINYQSKPSVFKKLQFKIIKPEHEADLIPFMITMLSPSLKPKKRMDRTQEIEWKSSTRNLLEYFANMKPEDLTLFIKTVIPNKEAIANRKDDKIKVLLTIMEEIIRLISNSYSFAYDPILEILVFLISRDIKEVEEEVEEDEMEVVEEEEEVMQVEEAPKVKKLSIKQKKATSILHQEVKKLSITLLVLFIKRHESHQIQQTELDQLYKALKYSFEKIGSNLNTCPNVFQIMFGWDTPVTAQYWAMYPDLFSSMISLIKIEKITNKALQPILDLLATLIESRNEIIPGTEVVVKNAILAPNTNFIIECIHQAIYKQELEPSSVNMLMIVHSLKEFYNKKTNPDVIVSLYAQGLNSRESLKESLEMLKEWIPKASEETKTKYIKQFSNSFVHQKDVSIRMTICQIFAGIGGQGSEIYRLLTSLNSYSTSALDQVDLESRFEAFQSIIKLDSSIKELSQDMLLPIVANLCFFSVDSQWIIRENASKALASIIRWIYKTDQHKEAKTMIIDHLKKLVRSEQVLKANVITPIVCELFKSNLAYKEYKNLDFVLLELVDDEPTKKTKVLLEWTSKFNCPKDMTPFFDFVMPILTGYLTIANDPLRDATCKLLHVISKRIEWDSLELIMNDLFYVLAHKRIQSDKRTQNMVLTLLCTLIQEWSERDKKRSAKKYFKSIIPQLTSYMWSNENLVRMEIALLIVKILKIYDRQDLDIQLGRIVLEIIGKLADRKNERQRELSRATLIAILKELGSDYFFLVLSQLSKMLNEGYKLSILHYTVLGLLKALKVDIHANIDDTYKTLPVLLDILLSDITKPLPLVGLMQLKEKKEQANYHLTYESFLVLGGLINEESLNFCIERIEWLLTNVIDTEVLARFTKVLEHLARGLYKRFDADFLINFTMFKISTKNLIHKEFEVQLEDNVFSAPKKYVDQNKLTFEIPAEPRRQGAVSLFDVKHQESLAKIKNKNDHMIIKFCLDLLEDAVRRGAIKKGVEPLVPKLVQFLSGKHLHVALMSLKILILIQKSNIASISPEKIIDPLFDMMLNTGIDNKTDIWDTLFTSIRHFLTNDKFKLGENQLNVLFDIIKVEVNGNEFNEKPFHLLALLVAKGYIVPQVYDIATRLETVILLTSGLIQQHSIQTLADFLLNYPMTPLVLQGHFDFLLKNMMNEKLLPEARQALVKMIHTVIVKFPSQFVNERIELFLFPLIVSVCNDLESRNLMIETTYELLKKLTSKTFEKVVQLIQKWIVLDKLQLVATKLIAISLRVSNGDKMKPFLSSLLPKVYKLIKMDHLTVHCLEIFKVALEWKKVSDKDVMPIMDVVKASLMSESVEVRMEAIHVYYWLTKTDYDFPDTLPGDLIHNLMSRNLNEEIASEIMKILVHYMKKQLDEQVMIQLDRACFFLEDEYNFRTVLLRRRTFLTIYAAVCNIGKKDAVPLLKYMIPLIHHIKEKKSEKDLWDKDLMQFNIEVMDSMKKVLGVEAFNEAYLYYEMERKQKKEKLRVKKVQKSILDPVQFAKDKMAENREKLERRKRKIKEGDAPRKRKKKNPKKQQE